MDRSEWIKNLRKLDDDVLDLHRLISKTICDVPELDSQRGLTTDAPDQPVQGRFWPCGCGELVEMKLDKCWNCGYPRP